MAGGTTSIPTFPLSKEQPLVETLRQEYGTRANITEAKRPGEADRHTSYRGYIVAVTDTAIAQRVDNGSVRTSLVVHDRGQLEFPASKKTGQAPAIESMIKNGRGQAIDISISYGADGNGKVYSRDRETENMRLSAQKLASATPLEGSKKATFEKNLESATDAYVASRFKQHSERAQAYKSASAAPAAAASAETAVESAATGRARARGR